MASMGTKEIVKLRERVKELESALREVVRTYERDHWGYEGDCIFMANAAALALGLERVHETAEAISYQGSHQNSLTKIANL